MYVCLLRKFLTSVLREHALSSHACGKDNEDEHHECGKREEHLARLLEHDLQEDKDKTIRGEKKGESSSEWAYSSKEGVRMLCCPSV